jgi:hypothetical protein
MRTSHNDMMEWQTRQDANTSAQLFTLYGCDFIEDALDHIRRAGDITKDCRPFVTATLDTLAARR